MDMLSYGAAGVAASKQKKTREQILGSGVEGSYPHTKARIDSLESAIEGVNERANKLIVNDTINIMKAHAKFNALAKTVRYKQQNMAFEDFLNASGIDAAKSSGYTLDTTNGLVKASGTASYKVVTTQELADAVPVNAVLVVEEKSPTTELLPKIIASTDSKITASAPWTVTTSFNTDVLQVIRPSNAYDQTLTEIQIFDEANQNITSQATITKVNSSGALTPSGLYDGNTASYAWDDSSNLNEGIQFQFSSERKITKVVVYSHDAYSLYGAQLRVKSDTASAIRGQYSISRDDGVTWESITPEALFYFTSKSPSDKKIRLKAELPADVQLLNYGLTWS